MTILAIAGVLRVWGITISPYFQIVYRGAFSFTLQSFKISMEIGSRFIWIRRILTFLFAFMIVSNYGGYSQPDEVVQLREGMLAQLQSEAAQKNDDESMDAINFITAEAELVLIPAIYQKHSLFRMVGSFIVLLGLILLRNLRSIGFHLLVAGVLFLVFTGFYSFGFGIFGWLFNFYYMFLGAFSIYYYSRKKAFLHS